MPRSATALIFHDGTSFAIMSANVRRDLITLIELSYLTSRTNFTPFGYNVCAKCVCISFPLKRGIIIKRGAEVHCKTINAVEGWHFGMQALFQCHYLTLWTFVEGIEKDLQMQRASFLQGTAGAKPSVPKRYTELKARVQNTVDRCLPSEILVQLISVQLRTFLILDRVGLYSGVSFSVFHDYRFLMCVNV